MPLHTALKEQQDKNAIEYIECTWKETHFADTWAVASLHFAPSVYSNEFCFHVGASSFSPRWPNQLNRKTLATALETHWGWEWSKLLINLIKFDEFKVLRRCYEDVTKMFKESPESRCEAVWTSWGSIFQAVQAVQDGEGDLYDPDVHILSMDSMYCGSMWISSLGIVVCSRMFKGRWILDDFVTILCRY